MAEVVGDFIHKLDKLPLDSFLAPKAIQTIQSIFSDRIPSSTNQQHGTSLTSQIGSHVPYMTRGQIVECEKNDHLSNFDNLEKGKNPKKKKKPT